MDTLKAKDVKDVRRVWAKFLRRIPWLLFSRLHKRPLGAALLDPGWVEHLKSAPQRLHYWCRLSLHHLAAVAPRFKECGTVRADSKWAIPVSSAVIKSWQTSVTLFSQTSHVLFFPPFGIDTRRWRQWRVARIAILNTAPSSPCTQTKLKDIQLLYIDIFFIFSFLKDILLLSLWLKRPCVLRPAWRR